MIAKAQPFSSADEDDEKTTIESGGWEEEASTTVEQGEVAEKIRALGLGIEAPTRRGATNITSTSGSAMEEPTVDDQHANAIIAMIPPPSEPARLIITLGNDTGTELQVVPGKTYTIGRGIDNDVVLTDIAVSRKHFDLTFEGNAWVLVDRGSGNGTLVNGNLEDQPFMLANGDTIEIGNTMFRFDNANGVTREAASYIDVDEEEPSTVAGKPMGRALVDTPVTVPPPQIIASRPTRPKTQPPPPLPRPRTQSGAPPPLFPSPPPGVASSVMPSTTMPLPQMAGRAPVATPQSPTLLGDPSLPHSAQMQMMPHPTPQHMPLQTTIPGGHSAPQSIPPLQGMPFGYPILGMDRPSAPAHAQMLVIAAAHAQGREAPTTHHVPPTPYHNGVMLPQQAYVSPQLSRRMKMVLGGAALALIAAVATVAIIKGASRSDIADEAVTPPATTKTPATMTPATTKTVSKTTVEPIKVARSTDQDAAKQKALDDEKKKADDAAKQKALDDANKKKLAEDQAKHDEQAKRDDEARKKRDDEQARRDEQAKRDEDARNKKAADEQLRRDEAKRKADEQAQAKRDEDARNKKTADDKRRDDQRKALAEENQRKADERKKAVADETARKADENQRKADERKKAAEARKQMEEDRKKSATASTLDPPSRSGKTSSPELIAKAKNDANSAYRAKNFQQAANVLRAAIGAASDNDTTDLKSLARSYEQFGKAYNNGMSPGAKAQEAFPQLRTAINFDAGIGGAYTDEIRKRLAEVAPSAAVFFLTHKAYKEALVAVQTAESVGSPDGTTKLVRSKLESEANRLYNEANSEAQTNTPDAKDKLIRVKDMLESKSATYQKASKLLASLP